MTKKRIFSIVAVVTAIAIALGALFVWHPWEDNSVYAWNLMESIAPNAVEKTKLDETFIKAVTDFSIELFQKGQTVGENSLISPLSVYFTLAMSANGAGGETQEAFQQVLGNGMLMEEINRYAYSLLSKLYSENQETMKMNNSIWFDKKQCGSVYLEFLQKNADYYGAEAFQINFANENESLNSINQWVSKATDGSVEKMLEEIESNTAMMLINTLMFDSHWKARYYNKRTAPFQNANEEWVEVNMLRGEKKYIENENATGFISEYKDEQYSFVALLPKEGTTLEEYVANLTGEEFLSVIDLNSQQTCLSYLPEFAYEYKVELSGALKDMGLESAFGENSNFSNLCDQGKEPGQIYISKVEHQTFIQLDEEGTKAGAVTVESLSTRGGDSAGGHYVFLNRPFLYAIIDNETKLPVFMGTVNQLEGELTEPREYSMHLEEIDGVTYRIVENVESFVAVVKGVEEAKSIDFNSYSVPKYEITYIEPYAYADNPQLEEVNFVMTAYESGLTIGKSAFANCPNLKKVVFTPDMGTFYISIEEGVFAGSEQVVLYIPEFMAREGHEAEVYLDALEQRLPIVLYNTSTEKE